VTKIHMADFSLNLFLTLVLYVPLFGKGKIEVTNIRLTTYV